MRKCFVKTLSIIVALTMLMSFARPFNTHAEDTNNIQVREQTLGLGIEHQEILDDSYLDTGDAQRINIVKADLNQPDVQLKTTKALDSVLEVERLLSQANREMTNEGYNFVAGINGDMYTLATGMPRGMHLKNGVLLNTYGVVDPSVSPTLAVDTNGQVMIETVTAEGIAVIPSGEEITVQMLNRTINNRVVLYTKDINKDSVVGLDREGGHIIFELDTFEDIIPGEKITGDIIDYVETHTNGDQITLEENQYVLAGYGNKADEFRELVENETRIEIGFDVLINGEINNSISEAISSYNWLVQDGKALTEADMLALGYESSLVSTKNARTAIGITADNEVIMMTIDKQTPTDSYSKGVTLETLAHAMLQEGAVTAVGLDGGGSTEMVIKSEGMFDLDIQNELSDGSERAVTNGIFINYSAEQTDEIGEVIITPSDLTIFQDTSVTFTVKATDTNGNPLNIEDRDLSWAALNGTIDSEGHYQAPNEALIDTVEATIDGVRGQVDVNVVDEINSFSLGQEQELVLNSGQTIPIPIRAWADNREVIIDPSAFSWEVADPSVASITDSGVLTIHENLPTDIETDVIVSIGEHEQSIHLYINKANEIIYNFENYTLGETPFPGNKNFVETYEYIISDERAMSGQQSLMLDYHFGGWTTANGAMYANFYELTDQPPKNLQADLLPQQLGMWMYADGQEVPWVRAIVVDGEGNPHTLNITPSNETWSGWRFITADISEHIPTPLNLYQVYLVETNHDYRENPTVGGQLFFDDIQWVYKVGSEIDITELKKLIDTAENITNDNIYTDSSYQALQDAIVAAKEAIDTVDSDEALDTAIAALQTAIDNLEPIDDQPDIDVTELEALIETAENITNDNIYTDDSYQALQDAIVAAKEAINTIDSDEALNTALTALQTAIDNLEPLDDQPDIDVTELEALIDTAENITNDNTYTDDSYQSLQDAIVAAKEAIDTVDSDEALDTAIAALQTAIDNLEPLDDQPDIDVTELEALIETAENITNDNTYTDSSYQALQDAIEKAKVKIDTIDSDEALNKALVALQTAIDRLEPIKNDDDKKDLEPEPETEDNIKDKVDNTKDNEDQETGDKLPKTATPMFNIMLAGLALLIVGTIVFIMVSRKNRINND